MTLTDALGWTLLHTIWEGAATALLLSVALSLTRSSRVRYLVACTALAASLFGLAITFLYFVPANSFVPAVAPILRAAPNGSRAAVFAFATAAASNTALPQWISIVWLSGVVIFQLRALGGWMAVSRIRAKGVCAVSVQWQGRLKELAAQLRVTRPVMMLESSLTGVPVVMGHLKPVILIPVGVLAGLPAAQIETILLHELAHVMRNDYLINLLQTMAEGLLFFHPATWWISNVIRAERENCCDDLAVAASGDAHVYALALTALAESHGGLAMAASGGSVIRRVRRLLLRPENQRGGLMPVMACCLLVIACALGLSHAQAAPQTPAVKSADTPYEKWLTEDVAYIIRDDERQAFQRLATNEEREEFVKQFWLRRDPTPDTLVNEYKEEHYRRIGYVNRFYSSGSELAGWKTDRGRVYITYGPADEIESHPSGSAAKPYPYEQWRYKLIEGVGQNVIIDFEDKGRTGDFHMTMDPISVRG